MDKEASEIITFRSGLPDDRSFILATWLRGLYYGNPWFKEIPKDVFMDKYHRVISDIMVRPESAISVAVLRDSPDVILGYSVLGSPRTLHWVFVKEAWRKIGIARKLIPAEIDSTTHLTVLGKKLKPKTMSFNPFLI